MNKQQLKQLIKECIHEVKIDNSSSSFLQKLLKLNPDWNPKKAINDFANNYDKDNDGDRKEHEKYMANKKEWITNIAKFRPSVKVGDWIKVYVRNDNNWYIGKIIKEGIMEGTSYGWLGYSGPQKIPAWEVRVFQLDDYGNYTKKQPNIYAITDTEVYENIGTLYVAQYDEIQSKTGIEKYKTYKKQNTFMKLRTQNIKVVDIK